MSEKTLRASLYFLGTVTVLYVLATVLGRRSGGDGQTGGDPALAAVLGQIDPASLSEVEIAGPGDTIRLALDGGEWTVNGFEADSGAVERFMRALEEVEVASVAARNPANHARLGLEAGSAWTLTLGDGARVLLGNSGPRFRTAYARLPDRDVSSLISGDLRTAATRPLLDWRNKVVIGIDTAAVATIRIERDGEATLYERQDSAWTADGSEADANTLRNILQELAGMRASGFATDGDPSAVAAEADRTVLALDADGNEIASLSLEERESNFRVTTPTSPYVFEIPTFRADRVAPEAPGGEDSG